MEGLAGLLTLTCPCGVGIGIPPELKRDSVTCPRCGRENPVPAAESASASSGLADTRLAPAGPENAGADPPAPMRYRRTGSGWESFRCGCGKVLQLGPAYRGTMLRCPACRSAITVEPQDSP